MEIELVDLELSLPLSYMLKLSYNLVETIITNVGVDQD